MPGYNDPNDPGNSAAFHTGKICIEPGCDKPAGTAWSPYWCFEHNVKRIDRISKSLKDISAHFEQRTRKEAKTDG
jgi:hypothetical protein